MINSLMSQKTSTRLSKKNDIQMLNATFNVLKEKIEEVQGTKYQFYKLSRDRSENKSKQRSSTPISELSFITKKRSQSQTRNNLLSTLDQNKMETKGVAQSFVVAEKMKICPKCENKLEEGKLCKCNLKQDSDLRSSSAQKVKISSNAVIGSILSISAKSRSFTQQNGSREFSNRYRTKNENMNSFNFNKQSHYLTEYHSKKNNNNLLLNNSFNQKSFNGTKNSPSPKNRNFHNQIVSPKNLNLNNGFQNEEVNFSEETWKQERRVLEAVSLEEIQKIAGMTEHIHSLTIDDILDLYSAKCFDNDMEYIPEQATTFIWRIKKNCVKRCLRLGELSLGPRSSVLLCELLKDNTHFCKLQIEKNMIGDQGACALASMIGINTSLIHLDLGSNGIGPDGFELLFCGMLRSNTLVSVDISSRDGLNRNRLGQKGANQLGELLRLNPSIQFLKLAQTQLNSQQLKPIMNGINEGKALQVLDLSGNELDSQCAQIVVNGIQNTTLLQLDMSNNCIENQGFAAFQDLGVHSKFYCIESLDLSNNQLSWRGLISFFDSMHKNQTLKKLLLNDSDFETTQFSRISEFLFENSGLNQLSLERCQIIPEGATCIAVGMEKNKNLTHLYLKDNLIKDKGAKSIADALSHKSFLQVLDLSQCKIEDEGGVVLAESLAKAQHLQVLLLRENSLHNCVGEILCNSLAKNNNIRKIGLERNPMSFSYVEKINICLKNNQILCEQKKIPLYNDILASMKGKPSDNEDLENELKMKQVQFMNSEKQIDILKGKLQKLLLDEEQKMIVVEIAKNEMQEEYDFMESVIYNFTKQTEESEKETKELLGNIQTEMNKLKQETTKMKNQIEQKRTLMNKRKEEQKVKKLNMQSKFREIDTAAKQSLAVLQKMEAQKAQLEQRIEEKKAKNDQN